MMLINTIFMIHIFLFIIFLNFVSTKPPSSVGGTHIQSRKLGHYLCPNNCSGHGNCNNDFLCKCWAGWGYTGADCSRSK